MNEQNELFSWNNIYEKAMDASFGDPELKAKDTARWQVRYLALEIGEEDPELNEIPEESIEYYCEKYNVLFDKYGNIRKYEVNE